MKDRRLINKLKRRRSSLNKNRGFRQQDKIELNDEVLQRSSGAYRLIRGIERRLDSKFGKQMLPSPDKVSMEKLLTISDLDRFDFDPGGGTDYGLRLRLDLDALPEAEVTEITAVADEGEYEEFTATLPTGAGAAQADYLYLSAPNGDTYAAWLNIDGDDTEPTGANYTGADNQVEVAITSADTAAQVAGKLVTALGAIADLTITDNTDGTVTFTYDLLGDQPDADTFSADDMASGSISVAIDNQGVASNLNSTSFLIDSPDNSYYVWLNVDSQGVDPAISGRTGIEVAISASDIADDVATAIAVELDAVNSGDDFDAASVSDVITVTNDSDGSITDASDVDTGFSFDVTNQGVTQDNADAFTAAGVEVGDVIQILTGALKGHEYAVVEKVDDNTLRLEDDSSLASPETEVPVKVKISGNKRSYY